MRSTSARTSCAASAPSSSPTDRGTSLSSHGETGRARRASATRTAGPAPTPRAPAAPRLLRDRLELVADAVARVQERVPRGAVVDLLSQLPDEDVHGAVTVGGPAAPHLLEQLVAADDAPALLGER